MQVLLIGNANSIHLFNYLRVVMKNIKNCDITIFNINIDLAWDSKINIDYNEYYKINNIKIINGNHRKEVVKSKIVMKIPKIRTTIYKIKLKKRLAELGNFDLCILHYVQDITSNIIVKNYFRYKRIISVFWGSDLLRNPKINSKYFNKLFNISYKIIFNSENMLNKFNEIFENKYNKKAIIIRFPIMSFSEIDSYVFEKDNAKIGKIADLKKNKIIVTIGQRGGPDGQHEQVINSLNKCNSVFLNKFYFVFMMTYGGDENYHKKIQKLFQLSQLQGILLTNYLSRIEIVELCNLTDIYVNVIKTDAFSAFMIEQIYAKSLLIYGAWLNYTLLTKNNFYSHRISNIENLCIALDKAVYDISNKKDLLDENRKKIKIIYSTEKIISFWQKEIFSTY